MDAFAAESELLTPTELLDLSVVELGLSNRTCNSLERHGILTVAQLLACCAATPSVCASLCPCRRIFEEKQAHLPYFMRQEFVPPLNLYEIENIGRRTVNEIVRLLLEKGFK